MKRQTWTAASVGIAAVMVLTGCFGGQEKDAPAEASAPATGSSTNIEPAPSIPTASAPAAGATGHDGHDHGQSNDPAVDEVAEDFALALVTWDTGRDKTESAADVRAKPFMTEELAGRTVEPERNSSQALWNQLQPLGAKSEPFNEGVIASEHPPEDTDTEAYRNYRMVWDWIGSEGQTLTIPDNRARNVYISLVKVGEGWKVADYLTSDLPTN